MLTSLRIQNFRSIRDASVKLGQVNLFIGPNNSGKSNFLKGISLLSVYLGAFPKRFSLSPQGFSNILPRKKILGQRRKDIISISAQQSNDTKKVVSLIIGYAQKYDEYEVKDVYTSELDTINSSSIHDFKDFFEREQFLDEENVSILVWQAKELFKNLKLYKFEPAAFVFSTGLSDEPLLEANGSNITPFLYTLSQNHETNFTQLRADLARCVGNLASVSTPPDPNIKGNLRLRFFDNLGNTYWAEEVSEGVLYFLALLCIVHQPDPPKLLLLEEPEKGIHPRRIREVMDFIFELARLRDIQIILTSHSPYVVDYFADIPECISVFDRENGETVIRNAGDIITETNAKLEAEGHEPIHYTDALGEYWVSGFLGGVPEVTGGAA